MQAAYAERILGLCKSIFRVDSVLVHLRDGDVVFARPGDTTFGEEQRRTACAKLAPPDGQAAVCEDPASDARQAPVPVSLACLSWPCVFQLRLGEALSPRQPCARTRPVMHGKPYAGVIHASCAHCPSCRHAARFLPPAQDQGLPI